MKKLILAAMATVMVAGSAYGATFEGAPMTLRGAVLKTLIRLQLTESQQYWQNKNLPPPTCIPGSGKAVVVETGWVSVRAIPTTLKSH
jgi:hypothetical protein